MIINSDLTQFIYFSLTELQELPNAFTSRAKVNWNIPTWGFPHLSTKKRRWIEICDSPKAKLDGEALWTGAAMALLPTALYLFFKGQDFIVQHCQCAPFTFQDLKCFHHYKDIYRLKISIFCIALNNTVASSMLKTIRFSEIFSINFNP